MENYKWRKLKISIYFQKNEEKYYKFIFKKSKKNIRTFFKFGTLKFPPEIEESF